jgi:D-lactate dehydrogenase (cytochrome)
MNETYHAYLQDESKMVGAADSISFPESERQIREILRVMREKRTPVTIQGGKTGIVGSAVPLKGHIMNLSRMNRVIKDFYLTEGGEAYITVEPGITLNELRKVLDRLDTPKAFFWPPDPSETTATVGGIAACDAKGVCYHLYGSTASYIAGLRVMNADGVIRDLKKGQDAVVVNGESKDLVDAYIGGEGMYGVITALTLQLMQKPGESWGICFFFERQADGMSFADYLRNEWVETEGASIAAIEYVNQTIIQAIESHKHNMTRLNPVPDIAPRMSAMVYVEIHGEQEIAIQEMAEPLMSIVSKFNGDPVNTWAFSGQQEMDRIRSLLHAAAETSILHIEKVRCKDHRITKLGIDVSVKKHGLKKWVGTFEKETKNENIKTAYWGHMGRQCLHIDILPRDYREFIKGKALLETWAERYPVAVGDVITFYGVGKLKESIFLKTVSNEHIESIIQLKKHLDPGNLWNPGNMIL